MLAGVAMLFFGSWGRPAHATSPAAPARPGARSLVDLRLPVPKWRAPPRGVEMLMVSYFGNLAVSLSADRDCHGGGCKERYYSLLPVAGGALQFGLGGLDFHEHHHGTVCLPLTLAAVAGQTVGLASWALFDPKSTRDWQELSLLERVRFGMSSYRGGTGVGVSVGVYD